MPLAFIIRRLEDAYDELRPAFYDPTTKEAAELIHSAIHVLLRSDHCMQCERTYWGPRF